MGGENRKISINLKPFKSTNRIFEKSEGTSAWD
jgi:hypothetical protein